MSTTIPRTPESNDLALRIQLRVSGPGETAEFSTWPPSSLVGAAVYEQGAIVVHRSLMDDCLNAAGHIVTRELLRLFPNGTFLSFGLHSVVNYFGYTVIQSGQTRRNFGGAEDHIDADHGELLPEENPHFERSTLRDGMRYFKVPEFPDEEFMAPTYGETLVNDLTTRLFGMRLFEVDTPLPDIYYFPRRPWWRIW